MPDQTPPPAPPEGQPVRGYTPTNSTIGNAIGAVVSILLIAALKRVGIELDTVSAVTLSGAITVIAGYFFEGGRK